MVFSLSQARRHLDERFEQLVHSTRAKSGIPRALAGTLIAGSLGLVWILVHATNGTNNVFLHVAYVPVIAAALIFGLAGGVLTAVAAGALVGPLMPLNVELGLAQPIENTIYRAAFFVLIGVTTAAFASRLRKRYEQARGSREHISSLLARNLRLFARLVAERDEQTGGHCERVAHNTVILARELGTYETTLRSFYWSGVLHDLGKLGVPEHILTKPGRLTEEEFSLVKRHPAFGAAVLLEISGAFSSIALGLRSHHERWDGSGYPAGLAGESIPLIGRVLAIVDVFEAVTSHRPYRGPMSRDEARALIMEGSGTHFDPALVPVFLRLEEEGLITREVEPTPLYEDVASIDVPAEAVAARLTNVRTGANP